MLYTCHPPGQPNPGHFPGPAHSRGRWFTVDIHCHVRSDKANERSPATTASVALVSRRRPRARRAGGQPLRTVCARIQAISAEQRIADMDRMGIDIQAISPMPRQTYYGADADLGLAVSRAINDNLAEMVGKYPDRFVGLGTIPFQAPELADPANWSGCTTRSDFAASKS